MDDDSRKKLIEEKLDSMIMNKSSYEALTKAYADVMMLISDLYVSLAFKAKINELDDITDDTDNVESDDTDNVESDDTPVYAVFYSVNNAAYISIDERMKMCIPVRNLAKAYCVKADLTSVAKGKNELSKYKLNKLKPIQIKFLTQKEYDETIGKAQSMKELIANMPKTETNSRIDSSHKVANFAKNTKNKYNNSYSLGRDHYYDDSHGDRYYDTFINNANSKKKKFEQSISMTDMIQNPCMLYKAIHHNIDDSDVSNKIDSYDNDYVLLNEKQYDNILEFDMIVSIINKTISSIRETKSEWITDVFAKYAWSINEDYMMDIDYELMNDAVDEWNSEYNDKIMYLEDFDPTIISFKENIEKVTYEYVVDECEVAGMAIYNYVRCLIAYQRYTDNHAR